KRCKTLTSSPLSDLSAAAQMAHNYPIWAYQRQTCLPAGKISTANMNTFPWTTWKKRQTWLSKYASCFPKNNNGNQSSAMLKCSSGGGLTTFHSGKPLVAT